MKNRFVFITTMLLFAYNVTAQVVNIPNANFKSTLVSTACAYIGTSTIYTDVDANNDGQIQVTEALAVTRLKIDNRQISLLTGIESFTNLQYLNCGTNQLTSLNVQGLTNLQHLDCSYNQIPSLNVQDLTNLQWFNCSYNYTLISLNVQGCTGLQMLFCFWTGISTLEVQSLASLQLLNCDLTAIHILNLQGMTNLQTLECYSTQIDSLNIQGCTSLQTVECHTNQQLTNLNVQGCTSLQTLKCYSNPALISLDVHGLTNLTILETYEGQLTNLNAQGCTSLQTLKCYSNRLTNLDIAGCVGLQTLSCYANQLTNLNVQGFIYLQTLQCFENQLTTLDVQNCINLQILFCGDNRLTTVFIKNGRDEAVGGTGILALFSNNANLAYICCDDMQIAAIQSQATYFGNTNCVVNAYCSFTPGGAFYTIQGENKLDTNTNGCDANDAPLPNMKYTIRDSTNIGSTISNTSGQYSIPVQAGTHTVTPIFENPTYFNVSPSSIQVTFPNTNNDTLTQNFCITPNGVHDDVEVALLPTTPARPGFDAKYQIVYKNKGTVVESDSILFRFDDNRTDFVSASPAPQSQRKDTLAWYFSNLQPFETRTITLTLNVNSPMETPAVNAGDIFSLKAVAFPILTDEIPDDNRSSMRQIVVGSLDPNDKTCVEGDKITPDMVGKDLHYMIRFENTGTYAAENIVVKDVIDTTKFDLKTLQITHTSHSCVMRIVNKNTAEFWFENINLPFTEPDKHGFVAFKIKTKPTLALGNIITNQADIFFDYNFPIRTNTARTDVVAYINTENTQDTISELYLQPNPVSDILTLKTTEIIEKIEVFDNLGRILQSSGTQNQSINVQHLPKGIYYIKAYSKNGFAVRKFVKA